MSSYAYKQPHFEPNNDIANADSLLTPITNLVI